MSRNELAQWFYVLNARECGSDDEKLSALVQRSHRVAELWRDMPEMPPLTDAERESIVEQIRKTK